MIRRDKTRQDKTRQDKTRQDNEKQDKTMKSKTRQENTSTKTRQNKENKTPKDKVEVSCNIQIWMKSFLFFVFTSFLQPTVHHLFMKNELKANHHLLDKSCSGIFLQHSFITDFITKTCLFGHSTYMSNLLKFASND